MAEKSRYDLYLEISQNLEDHESKDLRTYVSSNKLLPARDLQRMNPQQIFVKLEQKGKLQTGDLSLLVDLMTKINRDDFVKEAEKVAAREREALKRENKSDRGSDFSDETLAVPPAKRPRFQQPPGQSAKQTTTVDVSKHFDTVIKGVSHNWDGLAEELGFSDNDIKGLRHNQYLPDPDRKCREVLHRWKNKHASKATLQVLQNALININEGETAEKLEGGAGSSSSGLGKDLVGDQKQITGNHVTGRELLILKAGGDEGDGKIDVKVEKCDVGFWEKIMDEENPYKMGSKPRGYALVLNNRNFTNLRDRKGAAVDLDNINALLEGLSFKTHVLPDKTAEEIKEEVRAFSQRKDHRQMDCCFVVLMSHGDEGVIYGTDDKTVKLDDIFAMFDDNKCPRLKGKPKLFFIQACRGRNIYKGEDETDSSAPDVQVDLKSEMRRLLYPPKDEADGPAAGETSTRTDMFCGYATQLGYQAIRNTEHGSWFIQAITKVFMKHAKNTRLVRMMEMVKRDVSKREASFGGKQEVDFLSTLQKQKPLYFFPGED
uniref:Caspase 1/2 n=1 Tax=Branchiostoma lanceolatum TaxID=7740 RepID=G3FGP3_BRALA|nr:caspase 1/2 [Branchiostoma lanceolatum]